ncbi:MAG TPA: dienelactone hydrolase family protein [Hyphomicrobiaceae bacterium]|nr:dienelactone hydrolase family protein [Hyphomicrobiaceae bacterium]
MRTENPQLAMTATQSAAVLALLSPLLRALEMLALIARHLHPPDIGKVVASIGLPEEALRSARAGQPAWAEALAGVAGPLDTACGAALQAFAHLRAALDEGGDMRAIYRALRLLPEALAALYPLASVLPAVNQFFLDPALRSDQDLQRLLLRAPVRDSTGVMHVGSGERGGFWLYVPEHYAPDRAWPLVAALHGGSGTGRQFLWSWLRDARSRGAILAAPTSTQNTWALQGSDPDTPNLLRMLDYIQSRWNLDATRLLLTGMSDGGTFAYVLGLASHSPFTHLAPVSAAFHPLLVQLADPDRMRGLPIQIIHGALDWMFPVELAQQAQHYLASAGAAVTLREVDDLSHAYPRELNGAILHWLATTGAAQPSAP